MSTGVIIGLPSTGWTTGFVVSMATTTDPLSTLLQYGLAGVILILVITGQLHTKATVKAKDDVIERQWRLLELAVQTTPGAAQALHQTAGVLEAIPATAGARFDRLDATLNQLEPFLAQLSAVAEQRKARGPDEQG